jgi:signal transduction histidine kinase
MFRSVRARTTFVAAGVFGVAFILASLLLVRIVDRRVHDSSLRATRTAVEGAAQQIAAGTPPTRIQAILKIPVYYQLYDAQGNLMAGMSGAPMVQRTADGVVHHHLPSSGHYIVLPQRVQFTNGTIGTLIVAASLDPADRSIAALRLLLWLLTPLLIAMVATIVWTLVGRALRPVDAISSEVGAISLTTIDKRVPVPDSGDEIERLATLMNAMLDRLEHAQTRQREFVSDASHELRSPIASMRTELEVALRHPDAAEWPEVAQRVLGERDRLERLVDDLLELAHLDEGRALRRDELDLDDIVLAEAAHARRLPVRIAGVSAGRVIGDRRALEQMVRNLFDNATRHGTAQVAVHLALRDHMVVLDVDDDGPGVEPSDRIRIFERFARADGGRGREHGGAGLGLALVRRVVDAHGGTVECTASPLGGARFEVTLPAAD